MIWNSPKNELAIEWYEDKRDKKEFHTLNKTPLRLQLHPITGEVLRAYIKGARPGWVSKFAKEKKYRTHEATTAEGKGWWIANWSNYPAEERPLLCPFIKGMIEEWFEKLPDECQKDKESLIKKIDIVEINLLYYFDDFSKWGLHFRPEEILLDGGAMVLDKNLMPTVEEGGVFQMEDWPDYTKVVKELQEVREIPEGLNIKARIDEVEEETFVLELPMEPEIVSTEDEFVLVAEEDLEVLNDELIVDLGLTDEEFILPVSQEDEEELIFEDLDHTTESLLVESEDEIVIFASQPETEEPSINEEEPDLPEQLKESDATKPLIADKQSKKESIVIGQTLLF